MEPKWDSHYSTHVDVLAGRSHVDVYQLTLVRNALRARQTMTNDSGAINAGSTTITDETSAAWALCASRSQAGEPEKTQGFSIDLSGTWNTWLAEGPVSLLGWMRRLWELRRRALRDF
jgi:hypothetical protein